VIRNGTFPNAPLSVTRARRFVTDALADVAPTTRETAEILVSEVATNCVRHTSSDFSVRIETTGPRIRVDVSDQGTGTPKLRSPSASEPSGRGLRIVDLLSDRWGVLSSPSAAGKTVWFEIADTTQGRREPRSTKMKLSG
jgi:serine/threonine-protein kinase RsbW